MIEEEYNPTSNEIMRHPSIYDFEEDVEEKLEELTDLEAPPPEEELEAPPLPEGTFDGFRIPGGFNWGVQINWYLSKTSTIDVFIFSADLNFTRVPITFDCTFCIHVLKCLCKVVNPDIFAH